MAEAQLQSSRTDHWRWIFPHNQLHWYWQSNVTRGNTAYWNHTCNLQPIATITAQRLRLRFSKKPSYCACRAKLNYWIITCKLNMKQYKASISWQVSASTEYRQCYSFTINIQLLLHNGVFFFDLLLSIIYLIIIGRRRELYLMHSKIWKTKYHKNLNIICTFV